MPIKHPTDYFQLTGYRKMMLSILRQVAADLMLKSTPKNDLVIEEARSWVTAPVACSRSAGISFRDCLCAIGASSECDVYQSRLLADPEVVLKAASRAIEEINMGEGVFSDGRAAREPEMLSTTKLSAEWMFDRSPDSFLKATLQ